MRKVPHVLDAHETLTLPPVFSTFFGGVLTALGDSRANTIEFSRNAAGTILVNDGSLPTIGGTPTVANTNLIAAFGFGGNDVITLDETNGALPRATLFGGAGNDTLTGGAGADQLFGQADNDTLNGRGGNDLLFGGSGNDTLVGGAGFDRMSGEAGNDRMIWNPGDGNDVLEGGGGVDTAEVNGGVGSEIFSATANGARVLFERVDPAPFFMDIGTTEELVVNMGGGDDTFFTGGDLASRIRITVDGGAGDDSIFGGNGADVLRGGTGVDFVDGQQGADTAFLGADNDFFRWDVGDGSDVVEGQGGFDAMIFNGNGGNEAFVAAANGGRLRFTRDVGAIVMDTDDVERVLLNTLGGADSITINDLTGTDVKRVDVDLAGVPEGTTGDGAVDSLIARGTGGKDTIAVSGATGSFAVAGLPAQINVSHSEGALDKLTVDGGAGDDTIDASALAAGVVKVTLNGGAGNDAIFGSTGNDTLIGGGGNDFIDGQQGTDFARMGAGNDTFRWDPGDGNDVVEGQAGFDTMLFNGNAAAESVVIAANGERVLFTRNPVNITMDLNDVERIAFNAFDNADTILVNDLSGTDVTQVALDLGAGDADADTVTARATNGNDVTTLAGDATRVSVVGLAARIDIVGAEGANDRLVIRALAGDDVIDASDVAAGSIKLTLDGGDGNDLVIGGAGNDVLLGGAGDDVLIGGPGIDTLDGGGGDDLLIQDGTSINVAGFMTGAGSDDRIDLSGRGLSFDWLMAHSSDVDGSAVIDLGEHQITLLGVRTSMLHQDDFLI